MRGDELRILDRAAVLQISRDPGRPEGMAACGRGKTGGKRAALHHAEHISPRHRVRREVPPVIDAPEVVDVRLPAIRFDSPPQVRLLGKGRKERLCPLWPETIDLLRTTLRDRNVQVVEDVPLFVNAVGRPLTRLDEARRNRGMPTSRNRNGNASVEGPGSPRLA